MTRGRVLTRPELKCVQNHQNWRREGTEPYHSWDAANFKPSKSYSAQLKVSNNISNIEILFENFTFQITKNKLKCLKLVIILESRNGFSLEVVWIF